MFVYWGVESLLLDILVQMISSAIVYGNENIFCIESFNRCCLYNDIAGMPSPCEARRQLRNSIVYVYGSSRRHFNCSVDQTHICAFEITAKWLIKLKKQYSRIVTHAEANFTSGAKINSTSLFIALTIIYVFFAVCFSLCSHCFDKEFSNKTLKKAVVSVNHHCFSDNFFISAYICVLFFFYLLQMFVSFSVIQKWKKKNITK